jgi:GTP cyclohydrolase FolE2
MGFFKNFVMKQAIKSQMKGVPQAQQDMMMGAVEKNPKFFEDIAKEIEQKVKEGKSKTAASMEVMRKHQDELRKLMM